MNNLGVEYIQPLRSREWGDIEVWEDGGVWGDMGRKNYLLQKNSEPLTQLN